MWVAFKVGALCYGGGFVIVPLMQHEALMAYHWMTGAQFLNAVALGQVTPGPVVQPTLSSGTRPVASRADSSPQWWRLILILPAATAAAGYLQAALHFCANFGFRGVYSFGVLGSTERVRREEAISRDRRRALLISLGSLAIGLAVALLALAL